MDLEDAIDLHDSAPSGKLDAFGSRLRADTTHLPTAAERIAADVAAFQAAGGTVQKLDNGATAWQPEAKRNRNDRDAKLALSEMETTRKGRRVDGNVAPPRSKRNL